jgi:hypothetical protein
VPTINRAIYTQCRQQRRRICSTAVRASAAEYVEDKEFRIEKVRQGPAKCSAGTSAAPTHGIKPVCRAYSRALKALVLWPWTQISFGSILTPVGLGLLIVGFGGYFQIIPGGDFAALELIYGFPISILGLALSYAQLKPVPCRSTKAALELRDAQATDIQKQVWSSSGRQGRVLDMATRASG